MKYLIFGAGSTLAQSLIKKLVTSNQEVCGVLHGEIKKSLVKIPYISNVDISDVAVMQKLSDRIESTFGIPDHVINCAGASQYLDFVSDKLSDWYKVFDVNFSGSVNVAYCASQLISKRASGGSILLVGSGYGVRHIPFLSSYCVSKGALSALTRTLSTELALKNIRINLVTPGIFPSNMTEKFLSDDSYCKQLIEHIPDRQFGSAKDLADIIVFLCSKEAKHINGIELVVDGGMLNLIEGGIVR